MGLSIHYDIVAPQVKTREQARAFLEGVRKFAKTLPLAEVSRILPWKRGDEPMVALMQEFPIYDGDGGVNTQIFFAKPLEMLFFVTHRPGSEPANFGLARYSKKAYDMQSETSRDSGLTGWHWHHSCKTQYASMTNEGGWPNFFAIHDGICRILDHAVTLGAQVKVVDESNYWEHRDAERLHAEINRWNTMIAAVVGHFKDGAEKGMGEISSAPILAAPDFEHLEAKGQGFLQMKPEIHLIRLKEPKGKSRRRKRGDS